MVSGPKTCILDAKKSILEPILASKRRLGTPKKATWNPKRPTRDIDLVTRAVYSGARGLPDK